MPTDLAPRFKIDANVQFIKGVGPKAAQVLSKLGIETAGDLLYYLPFRYEDRTNFRPIGSDYFAL